MAAVQAHKCRSPLEQLAIREIRKRLPAAPTTGVYSPLEERAIARTRNILAPDQDFEDADDYAHYLQAVEWGDADQRQVALKDYHWLESCGFTL
jgi:hypothetical protein